MKRWIGIIIGIVGIILSYCYFAYSRSFWPFCGCKISIISPKTGDTVDCERLTPEDGFCVFTLKGQISSGKLAENESVYLLAQESGGSKWWVTGSEVPAVLTVNGVQWEMGWASIGKPNDNNSKYHLIAVATKEKLSSGQNLVSIPPNSCTSMAITVTRGKFNP